MQSGRASTTLVIKAVQAASVAPPSVLGALLLLSIFFAVPRATARGRKLSMLCGIVTLALMLGACGGGTRQTSTAPTQTVQAAQTGKLVVTATPSDPTLPTHTVELDVTLN
jgi:hypothetical protein